MKSMYFFGQSMQVIPGGSQNYQWRTEVIFLHKAFFEITDNKGDFLNHLKPFLYETYLQNKTILLIIDEAQNISHELLEEIRLLSNIELADAKLINIFIVGQEEY